MQRRELIKLLSGVAAWPRVARAQQKVMPVIGLLGSGASDAFAPFMAAFRQGLNEAGYVEGQNVAIEQRLLEGQYDRMPAIAAEFVQRQVAVIVTLGGTPAAQVAKAATSTIPIVFAIGTDPVAAGLVASFNRPGGNLTGLAVLTVGLAGKRLELLRDLLPEIRTVALLTNRSSPASNPLISEMQTAAAALGVQVLAIDAQTESDLNPAFESFATQRVGGLVVGGDQFHLSVRGQIVALAAHHKIPTAYATRDYVNVGGLLSYGASITDAYRQVGIYAGRVLKGEKPADLPVEQPNKFELVVNLKTAKALGLTVPPSLLGRADEVIE
jgi:putative tryptophan/tyrosine transport system substrate-binding protein